MIVCLHHRIHITIRTLKRIMYQIEYEYISRGAHISVKRGTPKSIEHTDTTKAHA